MSLKASTATIDQTSMPGFKLHDLILQNCGNDRIYSTAGRLREQLRALTRVAIKDIGRMREFNDEHLRILRALKAGDVRAAKDAASEHLANMYKALTQIIN